MSNIEPSYQHRKNILGIKENTMTKQKEIREDNTVKMYRDIKRRTEVVQRVLASERIRGKIREGIRANILVAIKWAVSEGMTDSYLDLHVDEALKFLHSQGVALKVERELPPSPHPLTQQQMLQAGYSAFESLIEEKK